MEAYHRRGSVMQMVFGTGGSVYQNVGDCGGDGFSDTGGRGGKDTTWERRTFGAALLYGGKKPYMGFRGQGSILRIIHEAYKGTYVSGCAGGAVLCVQADT